MHYRVFELIVSACQFPLKDTRSLTEKIVPIIKQYDPEEAKLFIEGIKNYLKPEINQVALEINILMQQPFDILKSYYMELHHVQQKILAERNANAEKMKETEEQSY